MLSRKEGRNYLILYDGEKMPEKTNRIRTDKTLDRMEKDLSSLQKEIKAAYNEDSGLYELLQNEVFQSYRMYTDINDGKCDWIDDVLFLIRELKKTLAEDDEIPSEEKLITLEDLGYKETFGRTGRPFGLWEKTIEESDEKSVVEEIQKPDAPLRRIRTILWEKTDYGRASKSITYRKLKIGKKLAAAIENTAQEKCKEDVHH